MNHELLHYFRENIYITTSGDFCTPVLKFVGEQIGYDRMMFSADYPYEKQTVAAEWFDGIKPEGDLTEEVLKSVAYGKAKELFKLK